ncbi:TolC family protein [Azohydromonas australica]|uniref:TolC family protein n=1 Tax=Azohydromonas australica TaxID=364039 RepID=UPI00041E5EFE|nr:TolC family protein [Azohydromonas australica]
MLRSPSNTSSRCRRAPLHRGRHGLLACALATLLAGAALPARAQSPEAEPPVFRLEQLITLARDAHPALAAARARVDSAQAAVRSAGALRNPEVEFLTGRQHARVPGAAAGSASSLSITQPIEWPALRGARVQAAEAALDGTRASATGFTLELLAELKRRYYGVLRSEAELQNAREDLALADQIRSRVAVRVDSGEAPRFELVRADTEQLNARRALRAAELRVRQAQHELRRLVGPTLPESFRLGTDAEEAPLGATPQPPGLMRAALLERHPELQAARAEVRAAQARLDVERQQRLPTLALRGGVSREPDLRASQLGVVVSVPLFDRRAGPVAEAEAELRRLSYALSDRELQLTQQLDTAWQQYQIAAAQVTALESGILRQAESAMRIAEAAYRSGERGILEWLDTQRAFRQARNDLDSARFDLRVARVELERLQAQLP